MPWREGKNLILMVKERTRGLNLKASLSVIQVHAYIISSLKKEMPSMFGKDNKKKELVNNLAEIYAQIERAPDLTWGLPNLKRMQVTRVWGAPGKGTSWLSISNWE